MQAREDERAKLVKEIELQTAAVTEAEAAVARANAEVATLAARYASEWTAPPAGGAGVRPEGGEQQEATVPLAFAEAKWAEREAQFAAELAALQALVAGEGQGGSASAAQSEAVDTQDPASLDIDVDDAGWKTVGRETRRVIAARHRTVLAGKVAASTEKVSRAPCPFQKHPRKG